MWNQKRDFESCPERNAQLLLRSWWLWTRWDVIYLSGINTCWWLAATMRSSTDTVHVNWTKRWKKKKKKRVLENFNVSTSLPSPHLATIFLIKRIYRMRTLSDIDQLFWRPHNGPYKFVIVNPIKQRIRTTDIPLSLWEIRRDYPPQGLRAGRARCAYRTETLAPLPLLTDNNS